MATIKTQAAGVTLPTIEPSYEVRARRLPANELQVEIWQLPSPASPHIHLPQRVAGLAGRNLEINQVRILKKLKDAGIRLEVMPIDGMRAPIREDAALRLALLFRVLAPMRSRTAMVGVVDGIEAMARQEAAYWLGMAVHRKNPRRVLTALRILLTAPAR
ncbi:DUF7680 family protein [Sphingobium sp. RAC03]|uniref:DUF7680 family protein n=1 Tax=Sphingobium sp. RAC03 TaxID=1843368 RepID=UPI00083E008F|nr:hypothetical protein [Sphingobium sp. RAC03]AOF96425.1 hypothetical protein BSY17_1604 [Sphingobium sp. RAC03]